MMSRSLIIATMAVFGASTVFALAQDVATGEIAFTKCQPCHSVGEDAKNKIGPALNGLDGRKAGTVENAMYSKGMKDSGITWNETTFKEFVSNPAGKVPGTMMLLAVKDEKELSDLWAYLNQFGSDGKKK
jgi:cytochrome c